MALSGSNTWDVQKTSGNLKIRMDWSATQNVANNYSDVKVNITVIRGAYGYNTNSTADAQSLWIDGTKYTATSNVGGGSNSSTLIMSRTKRVYHNSDGTKSFSMQFQKYFGVWWGGSLVGTQTFPKVNATLNRIPRASSISSISGGTLGSPLTVNISRASGSFTHKVKYYRTDGKLGHEMNNVGTSVSFTPSINDSNLLPNSTSGTAKIVVDTYSGSTRVGSTSKNFTARVPSSIVPKINSVGISEATQGLAAKFGVYVQNKSKLSLSISASGSYSSTIQVHRIKVNGTSYNKSSAVTDILQTPGTNKVIFEVVDSRGRTDTVSRDINVVSYDEPIINSLSATRSNSDGSENNEGTYVKISYDSLISPVVNKNNKTFKLRYKKSGTSEWSETILSSNSYSLKSSSVLPNFHEDYSYDIQFVATDYFTTVITQTSIPSGFTLLNFHPGGRGMAIGEVMGRSDGLDVRMETLFKRAPTIKAPTSDKQDNEVLKIRRADGSLMSYLSISEKEDTMKIHMYDKAGKWRSYHQLNENGEVTLGGELSVSGEVNSQTRTASVSFSTGFSNYHADARTHLRVTRSGRIGYLHGVIKNSAELAAGAAINIGIAPEGFRPNIYAKNLCQGTGANKFVTEFSPSGTITIHRYSDSNYKPISEGSWLNVYVPFISE
ncbi:MULTISPECIES: DUF859 family phage minor structural protein [Vagococcus]|uniref:DUF859 family phage minor structural protein n=1 Tax=Vagococcus TaxID=2737 RepID=UPI000E475290|nr:MULTISPECIES: DUF859 family phage minor structural protein [Vagococcus]RHH70093.1 hypothetical protein DW196_04830 [Vagococcus sp. AM17-17]